MSVTLLEAVNALESTLVNLLPVPPDPALAAEIFVNPMRSQIAGIGGIVGLRRIAPAGEVMARQIQAQVVVRVKATDVAGLASAEAGVSTALLGADPVNLRSSGVYRIARSTQGADATLTGLPSGAGRDVRFDVLYEFRKQPPPGGGVISTLPIDLVNLGAGTKPSELLKLDFEQNPMSLFDVVNESGLNRDGEWAYDAAQQEVRQSAVAGGGSNAFNPNKRGTLLVLRAAAVSALPRNFALYASLRSDVSGAIGLVFRYRAIDNFQFVLLNRPAPWRLFGKKTPGGGASFLDAGGQHEGEGYDPGQWITLRLAVQDERIELAIDGVDVLDALDAGPANAGRVGFMCRNNAAARFRFLRWVAL